MLFFLGGPLGAIVKKGGLGWPVITAILIFLVYFILTRAGEEMASNYNPRSLHRNVVKCNLHYTYILFIFYKANKDAKIFEVDWYTKQVRKLIKR